jgi:hypothetical protein
MPQPEDIRDVMSDLLGVRVSVDKRRGVPSRTSPSIDVDLSWVTGRYIDDRGGLIGACIADLGLAASAGAALAMIPRGVADESITAGHLSEPLRENFHEVISVVSSMLNGASVPYLRLDDVVDGLPDDVAELLGRATTYRQYDVTILGHGTGVLVLVGS